MKVKDLLERLNGVNPELDVRIWNREQEFTFEPDIAIAAYQDGSEHTEPVVGTLNVLSREFDDMESLTMEEARDTMNWWKKRFYLVVGELA